MKQTTLFISETKQNNAKTLTVPESIFKIMVMLPWILFEISLTLAAICKKIFLHKNEIVQYLQNYSYQDVNQDHFKKTLQASTNAMKNNCPQITLTFFTGCSALSYFLHLNCYNFQTALTKSINLHFLKILHFSLSKQAKTYIPAATQQELTILWKFLKVKFSFCEFISKNVKDKTLCFWLVKNMDKYFYILEFEITQGVAVKITGHLTCYIVLLVHIYVTLNKRRIKYQ